MNKTRIIFRADGNSKIGLGHVVRSLALAQMLRHEFECVFAIQSPDIFLQEQIKQVCDGFITLPPCLPSEDRFIYELNAYISEEEIVVVDGYNFDKAYQENIKSKGSKLVCIDDISAYPFVADIVLNQAGGVSADTYNIAPYTKLLLGPKYALLRPPFLNAALKKRTVPKGELKLLLNLGGADPANHTLAIAKELAANITVSQIHIVVGSAYLHMAELEQWIEEHTNISLYKNLSADEMCLLMTSCPVAVTSASGVAYEYASVGGLLYVKQTADNQQTLYQFLMKSGIATDYSMLHETLQQKLEPEVYEGQIQYQRQYFDGQSPERILQVFQSLNQGSKLTVRNAIKDDLLLLFNWANDPEVRKRSFNKTPIPFDSHSIWFEAKLQDRNTFLYVAEVNSEPAAHIRFEISDNEAIISYLISSAFRGKGLGHTVLLKGIKKLQQQLPQSLQIVGFVQKDNVASIRAFEKAGFAYAEADAKYPDAQKFTLSL
ncbi:UDP-2,4-diacetamido-2,4,6-trideoxy-beta-L-altropyranose hydrolase [Pontibacter silvestris]